MMKKRDESILDIATFVMNNTGMSEENLLHDRTRYRFPALYEAERLIREWIEKKKRFFIFADYDVDGVTSGESMRMLLNACGVPEKDIMVRYPRRFTEGYGMSRKAVETDFQAGEVCITVDNGIAAFDAIAAAKEKGMQVLVTDHHLAATDENGKKIGFPDADYIVDPNAIEGQADFTEYCGCGIILKLAELMLADALPDDKTLPRIRAMAGIATIADCVRLVGENRRIAIRGLNVLSRRDLMTSGLKALLAEHMLLSRICAEDVAFKIAPSLNASGRLLDDGAVYAANLLRFDGPDSEAEMLAKEQVSLNDQRKVLQKEWAAKADELVNPEANHIILYMEGCPDGIVGIVAGRLCEKHKVPVIVLTNVNGGLKGSGRSVKGVNLKALLDRCQEHLTGYGGHAPAAGVRLKPENLAAFRKAFSDALGSWKPQKDEMFYDFEIRGNEVPVIAETIASFAPYGEGNPAPVFLVKGVSLTPNGGSYYKELKANGLKLFAAGYSASTFTCHDQFMKLGMPRRVNLLGTISDRYIVGKKYTELSFDWMESDVRAFKKTPLQALLDKKAKQKEMEEETKNEKEETA